ncbi:MAG: YicC/YloC family endoribonuclease [candidate division Zixibacteria bacterium]|nr:YicC/YloC family endoribonuclease [candidate division Zixibacteria bacterium]
MNSMTGFGKSQVTTKYGTFTVEISSVNSRFLEVSVHISRQFSALEHRVRELIKNHLNRGKVSVFAGFSESENSPSKSYINEKAIAKINRHLQSIQKDLNLAGDITISDLLMFPDVTTTWNNVIDEDEIWPTVEKGISKAIKGLLQMRRKEGAAMARDMKQRLKNIKQTNGRIVSEASRVVEKYRVRLRERMQGILDNGIGENNGRLEQEIALFADRCDITEECTRLFSHIDQYMNILRLKEPVGKRINFLLQEMNREANTIASKASEIKITEDAISLKEEMEKLREMVQNVE